MFEFDRLATYRNVTHGEWKEDGVIEIYADPVIEEWPDTPHIFRVYKGETELKIQVVILSLYTNLTVYSVKHQFMTLVQCSRCLMLLSWLQFLCSLSSAAWVKLVFLGKNICHVCQVQTGIWFENIYKEESAALLSSQIHNKEMMFSVVFVCLSVCLSVSNVTILKKFWTDCNEILWRSPG